MDTDTTTSTDVLAELRATAQEFGVPRLAALMGIPQGTLWNKLSLTDSNVHHKTSLVEFIQILAITKNLQPLKAMNALFGCAIYPFPDMSGVSDSALLDLVNKVHIVGGGFHQEMYLALADGIVTPDEFKLVERQAFEWVAAILELRTRFMGLVSDAD